MQDLTTALRELLISQGACLVGVGDLEGIENCEFRYGISVAVPVSAGIVLSLQEKPTPEYCLEYKKLNEQLNRIVLAGENYLQSLGYKAYAQTTNRVKVKKNFISAVPHKTVATRAGLGWVGKNCLLVTEEFGSAVRLSSLFTDAPLVADKPVRESKCGSCSLCVNACPGHALKGTLWHACMPREDIVDINSCYSAMLDVTKENLGFEIDICGRCFAVCRYTKQHLKGEFV